LAKLKSFVNSDSTVTAGNSSGVNDGAATLTLATKEAAEKYGLTPIAKAHGGAIAGVKPRIMGFGPYSAPRKLMDRLGLEQDHFAVIETNEAFASQRLATLRYLKIAGDDIRGNPNGGAIALGHALAMSGARIKGTAMLGLKPGEISLSAMCIDVGQDIAPH
jgi:acetyl-CoA acyltransferase|tara:strand:+ start:1817 stop:2302 length:486 start_codon:yes stop_codon:yes gene_type:complete